MNYGLYLSIVLFHCFIYFFYFYFQMFIIRLHSVGLYGQDLNCFMTPGLISVRTFSVMCDHIFSKLANHQISHQATHKLGCQPGDCIWSLLSYSGFVWVCMG